MDVACWGDDEHGQVSVPPGLQTKVFSVVAGYWHNCAILMDGNLVCWGRKVKQQRVVQHHELQPREIECQGRV